MFSLKYKMEKVGRFGMLERHTTKLKFANEKAINTWLDSEVANGYTITEIEVKECQQKSFA